jgi:hypothetical protein
MDAQGHIRGVCLVKKRVGVLLQGVETCEVLTWLARHV